MERGIYYFKRPGFKNTKQVLELARERAQELGIGRVVIASASGKSAVQAVEAFKGAKIKLVAVTYHAGFSNPDEVELEEANRKVLERHRIPILMASHALSGVERSVTKKFGGCGPVEAMAAALRGLFGEGLKTCVEVSVMAADAGLVPTSEEVITIGGTGGLGVDTACVILPANMNRFFDLQVREIICIPRVH
ncbi:MAG: pyruvate kinase alpha/beta domain-containing protein [Candidatus Hydrothermarchaeota archaeon]